MQTITQLQTIMLPDGREAKLIVPELVDQLAVVDLKVIQRLAAMLPSVSLSELKERTVYDLRRASTIAEFVNVMKVEVSFHESVNLINSISAEELRPQTESAE